MAGPPQYRISHFSLRKAFLQRFLYDYDPVRARTQSARFEPLHTLALSLNLLSFSTQRLNDESMALFQCALDDDAHPACWSASLQSASIPDRHGTHIELADARAVSSGAGVRVVTYYIEVVGTLALEVATLVERFVHVCKDFEGIAASAEALDGEHHVPDAFFPLPPSHSHRAYLVLLPFTHTQLRKNSTVGQSS